MGQEFCPLSRIVTAAECLQTNRLNRPFAANCLDGDHERLTRWVDPFRLCQKDVVHRILLRPLATLVAARARRAAVEYGEAIRN